MSSTHPDDPHFVGRSGWLRAAVLGANDGIVSISSLMVGVAAATPQTTAILTAGAAGLVAGAMSMAAGEYVSVSSQADIERADIERERRALHADPTGELAELAEIYRHRGLRPETAQRVAEELTEHDALAAHTRDEIGLQVDLAANPTFAALASGATFSVAGAIPLGAALVMSADLIVLSVLVSTLIALAALGVMGARAGGAPILPALIRTVGWGIAAMAATAAIGRVLGVSIS